MYSEEVVLFADITRKAHYLVLVLLLTEKDGVSILCCCLPIASSMCENIDFSVLISDDMKKQTLLKFQKKIE